MLTRILRVSGALLLGIHTASAFEVTIQGKKMVPEMEDQTCIEIDGEYPGFRIEPSEAGKVPQICYSDARRDIVNIHNAIFVAAESVVAGPQGENGNASQPTPEASHAGDIPKEVVIEFEHTFPPGPNGMIMARAKIEGFFATATGLGTATGDSLQFSGYFSQGGQEDPIAEPFTHKVEEELESAIFESKGKKQYLIAGSRTLKAKLVFSFAEAGHKLALAKGASVSIDTGSRFEDKLEEMEAGAEAMMEETEPGEIPEAEPPLPPLDEELSL
ncbi:MAG: hypothetical protein ACPW60_08200 [Methylohalobius sp. ZOD2]|nr:hypothetical protein [Methylothermaceae bacterium]